MTVITFISLFYYLPISIEENNVTFCFESTITETYSWIGKTDLHFLHKSRSMAEASLPQMRSKYIQCFSLIAITPCSIYLLANDKLKHKSCLFKCVLRCYFPQQAWGMSLLFSIIYAEMVKEKVARITNISKEDRKCPAWLYHSPILSYGFIVAFQCFTVFQTSLTHVTALIWHQQITSAITVHCYCNKVCYHIHEGFIWRLTIMWSINQICSLWKNTGAGWCLLHSITIVYSSVQNNANNYSHGLHSLLHCVVAVMGHFPLCFRSFLRWEGTLILCSLLLQW